MVNGQQLAVTRGQWSAARGHSGSTVGRRSAVSDHRSEQAAVSSHSTVRYYWTVGTEHSVNIGQLFATSPLLRHLPLTSRRRRPVCAAPESCVGTGGRSGGTRTAARSRRSPRPGYGRRASARSRSDSWDTWPSRPVAARRPAGG